MQSFLNPFQLHKKENTVEKWGIMGYHSYNNTPQGGFPMADIQKLLAQMTLEEKIGQLMQYNGNVFMDTSA